MLRNRVSNRGIAYRDVGDGPAVLLLHAFGLDSSMWDGQVATLVASSFRVITPDMRGFGRSPDPGRDFRFQTIVEDTIDVLDHAEVDQAAAVGLSMGAATAIALAITRPDRVTGLLLADNSLPDGPERGHAAATRIRDLGTAKLADVYEPILFGTTYRQEQPEEIAAWKARLAARSTEALATMVGPYHSRPTPGPQLPLVQVPTLVVYGEEDAAIPPSRRSDYLTIPGSHPVTIPDAGHCSNLEQPEAFDVAMIEMLTRAFPDAIPYEETTLGSTGSPAGDNQPRSET